MIDDYFRAIDALLATTPMVREYDVHFDKRSLSRGYLRGDVIFQDDSRLHFREFVSIERNIVRMVYAYHFQRPDGTLVFRYDNTPHYPNLQNAPHHRHGQSGAVIGIQPPDLEIVLNEIELLISID